MRVILHITLLILYVTVTNSSLYSSIKSNVLSLFDKHHMSRKARADSSGIVNIEFTGKAKPDSDGHSESDVVVDSDDASNSLKISVINGHKKSKEKSEESDHFHQKKLDDHKDAEVAQKKAAALKKAKYKSLKSGISKKPPRLEQPAYLRERFEMDPVLNLVRSQNYRKRLKRLKDTRRKKDSGTVPEESSDTQSSSRELGDWKKQWKEHWLVKKLEAMNASAPQGDVVNMVAARPWGVPCGDPNQHDMPWGSCTLPMECEPEYRVYRGDFYCGRTEFVCCAIQLTNYDLYQGFDVSFDDKSLSTDSAERHGSGENTDKKNKKNDKEREKRRRERDKRKKKIKKRIKKIVKEIKKMLNKQYRNATKMRKKKTSLLKKFIKDLKKQYKKDQQSVKDLHEEAMLHIDTQLMIRLNQIRDMNENFMNNATFRDIVVNGRITETGARMLLEAYPDLSDVIHLNPSRRSGPVQYKPKDYLDYDIEYGYLYYDK